MESFAELAVHMEHIVGTHDIAFEDFNRGRMAHRLGGATGGAGEGGQQKSGTVKTNLKSLLLQTILLNATAACSCWGTGSLELGKAYLLYLVSLIFIFPGEIPSSDSTKSSSFPTFFFEKGVWHKGGCNFK